jgi:hypothetical protein
VPPPHFTVCKRGVVLNGGTALCNSSKERRLSRQTSTMLNFAQIVSVYKRSQVVFLSNNSVCCTMRFLVKHRYLGIERHCLFGVECSPATVCSGWSC